LARQILGNPWTGKLWKRGFRDLLSRVIVARISVSSYFCVAVRNFVEKLNLGQSIEFSSFSTSLKDCSICAAAVSLSLHYRTSLLAGSSQVFAIDFCFFSPATLVL
jgi:hypothetical protein